MADSYLEKVAGELADLALADQAASGDIAIVDQIGEMLGASSQTLQESYLTAVRVRRAEARARALLAERAARGYAKTDPASKASTAPADPVQDAPSEESGGGPRRVKR
ncbi:hypothetical protein [Yoonia sp.]|uniref:hypothetical protein n=1 Tax=Yoonia sp. TaxID=2212373 RepID=UPI00391B89AD